MSFTGPALRIRQARVAGAAAWPDARERLAHRAASLLPESTPALVLVRHWRAQLPATALSRPAHAPAAAWQGEAVRLRDRLARARRPWHEPVGPVAEVVAFADVPEWLASAAQDLLGGTLEAHWWWERQGQAPAHWLARHWLAHAQHVPAALALLDARGLAWAACQAVPPAEAAALRQAVALVHGLPHGTVAALQQVLAGQARLRRALPEVDAAGSVSTAPAAPSGRGDGWALAVTGLALVRAPAAWRAALARGPRGHGPARGDWGTPSGRADEDGADLGALAPGAWWPRPVDGANTPQAPRPARRGRLADATRLGPLVPHPTRSAATAPDPVPAAPSRADSGATMQPGHATPDGHPGHGAARVRPATGPGREAWRAEHATTTRPAQPANMAHPATGPHGSAPPWARSPGLAQAGVADIASTRFGGLFHLVNVALALGLYGDFTRPRQPGLALHPWDFLALAGEALLGRAWRADPLPAWLAQRAGRLPGEPAGHGLPLAAADWTLPPAWLAPWPPGRAAWRWAASGDGRLALWHPAGFCAFDGPGDAAALPARLQALGQPGARLRPGAPAPRPLGDWAHWMARFAPFLRARLARAMGCGRSEALRQVLQRPARLEHAPGRLVVALALAELPLALRLAGLDRDPGWVPAAGIDLRFRFD
jgi:hypothetical protein